MRIVTISAAALLIALVSIADVTAQQRPVPQAPPRRAQPAPRTAPPPKRGDSAPAEPDRPAQPAAAKPAPEPAPKAAADMTRADVGAALYKKNGCYECHVNSAQGGPQGPRLGPNPIPMPRFMAYVRAPAGDMPPFTKKVIPDEDLASIYAFLQALPTPQPIANIPLLAP